MDNLITAQPLLTSAKQGTRPIYKPHDQLTKRGWLFLGENGGPCNRACRFCYYAYQPDLVFFDVHAIMQNIHRFRYIYEFDHCDISGGEPTIYPDLLEIVKHCEKIGLKPTIITHGQNNTETMVKSIEDAGLDDWLLSMHGLREGHDAAVLDKKGEGAGGWDRLVAGIKYMKQPVRFNTTLQAYNYKELPTLAQWLIDNQKPTVWNMIQFNPFHAWGNQEVIEFQEAMTELSPYVQQAVELAEAAGWEVNLRYFPFCVASDYGFERNCINYYQTQYDPHEWGLEATNRITKETIDKNGGVERVRRLLADGVKKDRANGKCDQCRFSPICEGPTSQYQKRYGLDEIHPSKGAPVIDITYFEKPNHFWNDNVQMVSSQSDSGNPSASKKKYKRH
jgi:MoaA/NifB/PqqE/SkfB family radical SAM enzyme